MNLGLAQGAVIIVIISIRLLCMAVVGTQMDHSSS